MIDSRRSSRVPSHFPRRLTFELLEERRMLATIMVTSLADDLAVDGQVTLREAIHAAEDDISVDGSTAGSGADIIEFANGLQGLIDLSISNDTAFGQTALVIASSLTIRGNANGIALGRGLDAPEMRLLLVTASGNLSLESLMLTKGVAIGAAGTENAPDGGDGRGGAVFSQGTLSITASTLHNHRARGGDAVEQGRGGSGLGGAIYNDAGMVTIVNTTISGNIVESGTGAQSGSRFGAGIYSRNGSLTISNSTITNSTAPAGRGVYVLADGEMAVATVEIDSTIIGQADSSSATTELVVLEDNGGTAMSSGDGNLIRRALGFNGAIVSSEDPLLETLAPNGGPTWTHALGDNSPALDQGLNPLDLMVDQRGATFGRVINNVADIGAFERQSTVGPLLLGDYNEDLSVDAADYVFWRKAFGAEVAAFSGADGDGDGEIGDGDFGVWQASFGNSRPNPSATELAVEALSPADLATGIETHLPDSTPLTADLPLASIPLPADSRNHETVRIAAMRAPRSVRAQSSNQADMILISVLNKILPQSREPADELSVRCSSAGTSTDHSANQSASLATQIWDEWPTVS
jgi:hypothetical protein